MESDVKLAETGIHSVLLMVHKSVAQDYFRYYNNIIIKALRARNIAVDCVDMTEKTESWSHIAAKILRREYDAALVLNSWGEQNVSLDSGENLFDKAELPFYNWIMDHPAEHMGHLSTRCRNYHMICVDRDHVIFLKKYYPDIRSADFLPLPVEDEGIADTSFESFTKRRYAVVFSGNCQDTDHMRGLFDQCPEDRRELLYFLAGHLLEHRELSYEAALEEVLEAVYEREMSTEEMREYVSLTTPVIPYIRACVREEVIRKLMISDIRLHLFGNGWDRYQKELSNGNTVLEGTAGFEELSGIYRNSKMVLNVMPWFRNGSHDRIPMGMFAGAAVVTDHSGYLDEIAEKDANDNSIVFYDIAHPGELEGILKDRLHEAEELYETAFTGRKFAEKRMHVDAIIDELIRIMERNKV